MPQDNIQDNKLHILGKLTASLVHEIRNPLSAIKLHLDYLKMLDNDLTIDALNSVNACLDATKRLEYLIENVLDFSRKNSTMPNVCSINDVSLNAIEIAQIGAKRLNIRIEKDLNENLPHLYFERNKLLQVFLNLLTNAIESCDLDGRIIVRTYEKTSDDEHSVFWEVEDNGIGIGEEDKQKIFTDFFTRKKKGTGLGLSVCKMLLKEFDADLNFESEYGKGSRFYIKFIPNIVRKENENQNISYR